MASKEVLRKTNKQKQKLGVWLNFVPIMKESCYLGASWDWASKEIFCTPPYVHREFKKFEHSAMNSHEIKLF